MKTFKEIREATSTIKDKETYEKAKAHLQDLRKYKRLGIEHPSLKRKVKGADIAGAKMALDKHVFVKF